jgi:hypothetical protein
MNWEHDELTRGIPRLEPGVHWSEETEKSKQELAQCLVFLQTHAKKLESALDAQPGHSLRLEAMLSEFVLSFSKFGISIVFEPSVSPMITFTKNDVEVRLHHVRIIEYGMWMVINMFNAVPDTAVRHASKIEGIDVTKEDEYTKG